MKPAIKNSDLIFADTSVFCRFEEALRWPGLVRLLDYFDTRLRIVTDVRRELDKHARRDFKGLSMLHSVQMHGEFLRAPAEVLPAPLAVKVTQIAPTWDDARESSDRRKNFGEVATVLMACHRGSISVIDDGNGQRFARDKLVTSYTTRDVAVEMTIAGALEADDAAALWASVFRTRRERSHFDAAVNAVRQRAGSASSGIPRTA